MKILIAQFILIILSLNVCAQFSDDIMVGPAAHISYSDQLSQLHMSGRVCVPGDFIDVEADLLHVSFFLNRNTISRYGVSWVSFLWIPPFIAGKKIPFFNYMSIVMMGINGVLNANIGFGNSWIRGTLGWKNDIFLFRDFLWVFSPEIGCKLSLPQKWMSDGAVRVGVDFPAYIGKDNDFTSAIKQFHPRFSIGIDLLLFYTEVFVGGK